MNRIEILAAEGGDDAKALVLEHASAYKKVLQKNGVALLQMNQAPG
jgi:hypothetical protein